MSLSEIRVHDMRSYPLFSAKFQPGTTLILGRNGSGKTTLLEAIYMLYQGTSFRGSDREIIRHDHTRALAKAYTSSGERQFSIEQQADGKLKKHFTLADKNYGRLTARHRLPVVLFEPDELRLLTSSPQRRRDFIDGIIARLSSTYSTVISRYIRTLSQRNELLKQYDHMQHEAWESHLFAWDVTLSELGATIIRARQNFLQQANKHLSRIYSSLVGTDHVVLAHYSRPSQPTQQSLLAELHANRQNDALRGFTSTGPHRDDLDVQLDHHPASETASRGELRSIMLAFKLLEIELQQHHSGAKPLVLLDDVFSELDSDRETKLLAALRDYQAIITATDSRDELTRFQHVISL